MSDQDSHDLARIHRPANPISAVRGPLAIALTLLAAGACGLDADPDAPAPTEVEERVADAIARLPKVEAIEVGERGVPAFIDGELAAIPAEQDDDLVAAEAAVRPALDDLAAPFLLRGDELALARVNVDDEGNRHFRYGQTRDGLEVIGGGLVVHADVDGTVYAVNGSASGELAADQGGADIGEQAALAAAVADPAYLGMAASAPRPVYVMVDDVARRAYEVVVAGDEADGTPLLDKVYVDGESAQIVAVHPQIETALFRRIHNANHTQTLGPEVRHEGQAPVADVDNTTVYNNLGVAYNFYKKKFGRDSYDAKGAPLVATVHFGVKFCNAFWNRDAKVLGYGDGNPAIGCKPLSRAFDVTAHEMTHGVTQIESGLLGTGESGGLNEALSDIFAAGAEAFLAGGQTGVLKPNVNTWRVAEGVFAGGARFMDDPAHDGKSLDVWTAAAGNANPHLSSGIANLAFYLMSEGGTHPRGRNTIVVNPIGLDRALQVFNRANRLYLVAGSKFANARSATMRAAADLKLPVAMQQSIQNGWAAVGVGAPIAQPADVVLVNNRVVAVPAGTARIPRYYKITVPTGAKALSFTTSAGTGDADLYVRRGARATVTSFTCRPRRAGNAETCSMPTPAAGVYYVMVRGFAAYSGVRLVAKFTAP